MKLRLGDLDPFNFPDSVPNDVAQEFFSQTLPSQEFEFSGEKRPKSVLITTVQFTGPRSGIGKGILLSVDADTFFNVAEAESDDAGMYDRHELVKRYCVGLLEMRLEPVMNVYLTAKPVQLA